MADCAPPGHPSAPSAADASNIRLRPDCVKTLNFMDWQGQLDGPQTYAAFLARPSPSLTKLPGRCRRKRQVRKGLRPVERSPSTLPTIRRPTSDQLTSDQQRDLVMIAVVGVVIAVMVMVEGEQVHEITNGRAIFGLVLVVVAVVNRVREIVAAPIRNFRKIPVLFDELQQRDMVVVGVVDVTPLDEG